MKNFIRLSDYSYEDIENVFTLADELKRHPLSTALKGKTIVLFFPESSLRTRLSFEKGINLLGGQAVYYNSSFLETEESMIDLVSYLNNWADAIVVRVPNIEVLDTMALYADVPIINAMTHVNHPCELLSDLYQLSKMRENYLKDHYLYIGGDNPMGRAWREAADYFGLHFTQCAPEEFRMDSVRFEADLAKAIEHQDIVIPSPMKEPGFYADYQVNKTLMERANSGALLNPVAPFYRGEEVHEDALNSSFFVGHAFKRSLLEIHQAILLYSLFEEFLQKMEEDTSPLE